MVVKSKKKTSSVAHHKQAPDRVYQRRKKVGGREKDIHLILQKRSARFGKWDVPGTAL